MKRVNFFSFSPSAKATREISAQQRRNFMIVSKSVYLSQINVLGSPIAYVP